MQEPAPTRWPRALAGLAALLFSQLPWIASTNFGGFDEWMMLELNSRGVLSVPYAHRPLGLIWSLPGAWLAPLFGFAAFRALFAVYALLSAALLFQALRRLLPEQPLLALLASGFLLVWAPGDLARLSSMESAVYQGITLGALLAAVVLIEAWKRGSALLLGAAALAAFVAIRCYEGVAALLAAAPALLLLREPRSRRLLRYALGFELAVAAALGGFLLEMAVSQQRHTYQGGVLGLHLQPADWLGRMGWQYLYHFSPLFLSSPRELLVPAVPLALAALLAALALAGRAAWREVPRRPLLGALGAGLALAGLGYSLILLGVNAPAAFRLQFLSGPGAALALAAAVLLGGSLAGRGRVLLIGLLSAWVVAVGTGRTLAMQRTWDQASFHDRQMGMLRGLLRAVPDVTPGTLLVLLDEGQAWRGGFGFHHAVQYLYERRAAGYVLGLWDPLYPAAATAQGFRFEPWPAIRVAWQAPRRVYRHDEVVVVRHTREGGVHLLEVWPTEVAPLPPGARYEPRSRLAPGPLPRAAILPSGDAAGSAAGLE